MPTGIKMVQVLCGCSYIAPRYGYQNGQLYPDSFWSLLSTLFTLGKNGGILNDSKQKETK
jgi:hypothetical protein